MGWMQKCYEVYNNNIRNAGKTVEHVSPMCPIYFIVGKAQIEIALTEDGTFVWAKAVGKGEEATLIPATEKSASRSNGIAPHPLCDQLQYIVLGNPKYAGYLKYKDKYEAYMTGLKKWADFSDNFIVSAVYKYCLSGDAVHDLTESGIIALNGNNPEDEEVSPENKAKEGLLSEGKVGGMDYEKALVRWIVIKDGEENGECWRNESIFQRYAKIRENEANDKSVDICFVTGEQKKIATMHAKGIVPFANNAKLLSANDSSGFTYRGRFETPMQAYSVGEEVSLKAHCALRWLVSNFAVSYGKRITLCFNPGGKKVPLPDALPQKEDDGKLLSTEKAYKNALIELLKGHEDSFSVGNNEVIVMAMEAATTGRLSVTYYSEFDGKDYLDRIRRWNESFNWYALKFTSDKKPYFSVATPMIKETVNYAFGTEQGKFVNADEKVLKEMAQVLIGRILGGQSIPYNFVSALVGKTMRSEAYSSNLNRERLLSVACAAVKKYYNDKYNREEIKMELDETNTDRSYLFGRLLAVEEKVERATYTANEQVREPNALRLQSAFAQHPLHTFNVLEKALASYYAKLNPGSRFFYKDKVGAILASFAEEDKEKMNQPLGDQYIIGYYLQRKELNTKNKSVADDSANNNISEGN